MATDLLLPSGLVPSNLHLPKEARAELIDSDMFHICDRVKEISPTLHIFKLYDDDKYIYTVMEHCSDGVERLIFKVKALDNRVITRLQTLFSVELDTRIRMCDKENHRFEAHEKEEQLDDLYERLGRPMWTQLEHDGFIQRGVSYPKAGVATRGKKAR